MRIDLYRLFRNLKLKKFFAAQPAIRSDPFRTKSTFTPNIQDPALITFEKLVLRDLNIVESNRPKYKNNLSRHEFSLLNNLKQDPDIVIKPADKGGGLVIMDTEMYKAEAYRQLNDITSYQQIDHDPTRSIARLINVTVQEALALDYISNDTAKFLIVEFPRIPTFYLLPKIHKSDYPPKGRPIVAAQQSLLENISKYVDFFLQPFVKKTRTYIQDTRDFISKIEGLVIPPPSQCWCH